MVYYKRMGSEKIIHVGWCMHVRRMDRETVGKFKTAGEAIDRGYRVCRACEYEMRKYGMLPPPKRAAAPKKTAFAFTPSYGEQLRMTF